MPSSAWADAWGDAWGDSWGSLGVAPVATTQSGVSRLTNAESYRGWNVQLRRETPKPQEEQAEPTPRVIQPVPVEIDVASVRKIEALQRRATRLAAAIEAAEARGAVISRVTLERKMAAEARLQALQQAQYAALMAEMDDEDAILLIA